MSDELKRCPYCGGKAKIIIHGEYHDYACCANPRCPSGATLPVDEWQTRPLEDDLTERLEHVREIQSGQFHELQRKGKQLEVARKALEEISNGNNPNAMIADNVLAEIDKLEGEK